MLATHLGSRIAQWVGGLSYEGLPGPVVERLKLAALDTLAAILSGVPEPVSLKAIALATEGQKGPVSILGHRQKTTLLGAAFANGTMAHACDYDDSSWTMWGHPSAPVVPAVLAAIEARDLSGRDFLVALAVGLEVEKTLGLGCQPEHYLTGWHATASLGVFGAAAGTAKALGLDHEATQMALGIAVSRAAALRINSGTMTKPLHVGFAARDGAEAALLAAKGATSNPRALEGPAGFFDCYSPKHGPVDAIADKLGNPFEVVDPGLSPKLYPCCSETHSAVDAILELRARHGLTAEVIKRIRVGITPAARGNLVYSNPQTPLEAKFSQEYALAAALVHGRLGMREFDADVVADARVRDLIKRIEVSVWPELSGQDSVMFSSPAIVRVELTDGRTVEKHVREMRGHPKNPLAVSDIEAKFVECGGRVLPMKKVRSAMRKIKNLEKLDKIRDLIRDLRSPAR